MSQTLKRCWERNVFSAKKGGRYLSNFPPHPSFPEYRAFKNDLLAIQEKEEQTSAGRKQKQAVLRLDCMKPATALQHYLQPVPLCRPPFTHSYEEVASELTSTWAPLSCPGLCPDNMVLTRGVRDGIFVALEALSLPGHRNAVIAPADVYPVYEKLVQKTSASSITEQFSTLADLDIPRLLASVSSSPSTSPTASTTSPGETSPIVNTVLLLPHPLTPLGRSLTTLEIQHLTAWLTDPHPSATPRYLLLDCVYSFPPPSSSSQEQHQHPLAPLLALPNVAALHSLSKGWLSPFLEPIVVSAPSSSSASVSSAPTPAPGPVARSNFSTGVGFLHCSSGVWRRLVTQSLEQHGLQPLHSSLQQALFTLQQQPLLPQLLAQRIRSQWAKLESGLRTIDPSFSPPLAGYFSTVRGSWEALYAQHGAMTVPASVFGAPVTAEDRSVISCLYDIKDDDFADKGSAAFGQPGQESTPLYHVTLLSNFIRGYDKYSRRYSKTAIPESTFADQFFLLHAHQLPTGVEKASKLLRKLDIPGDTLLVLHTDIKTPQDQSRAGSYQGYDSEQERADHLLTPHPKGQYVRRNWVSISALSLLPLAPGSSLQGVSVEEAAALSLRLQHPQLLPYQAVQPRSVSIMPIAKGCQAKCPFCFSKGSVSSDIRQQRMYGDKVEEVLQAALARGAQRAVITGGGEPFMLPFPRLLALIQQCSDKFSTVCAISNGYSLSQLEDPARLDALKALDGAGLTVLSLSRHAATEDENEKIMWLRTESPKVAETWRGAMDSGALLSLTRLRWVCVLQKGGIDSTQKMHDYLAFVAASGANEVCFKELYVSTTVESVFHDHASNVWSTENQVPLSLVIDFCEANGFVKTGELPWGAPIYEGVYPSASSSSSPSSPSSSSSRVIKIAAYTEPSVFWERSQGLCRSWNYMASGEVLASLEDKDSQVDITLLPSPDESSSRRASPSP